MTNITPIQVCPACQKEYTGFPALSRTDNVTSICSSCGEDEAFSRMTLAHSMNNRYQFQRHLEAAYVDLFENDPEYAYARARKSPEALADVMTASLAIGEANTDGAGIRRACKAVGIPQTRKAITAFLNTPVDPSRPQ